MMIEDLFYPLEKGIELPTGDTEAVRLDVHIYLMFKVMT
jgi:hypothetical protein